MSYIMKTKLANRANYGGTRNASDILYLIIHYTANDGDSDEGNANYFYSNVVKASAHYFADDDSITNTVPDLCVAYAVGGDKWSDCARTGGGTMYKKITNFNSISIEICDSKKDGKIQATEATMDNVIAFTKTIMKKYNIPISNVYRHFDVNGKHCPAYMMDNKVWEAFKARLSGDKVVTEIKENTNSAEESSNLDISFNEVELDGIYNFIGNAQYISSSAKNSVPAKPCRVKITKKYLATAKHPILARSVNEKGDFINGVYGWIDLKDIKFVSLKEYKVRVTASSLNIRSGPATSYRIVGSINDKGVYTIVQEKNGWGQLKSELGWISLYYTAKL